MKNHANNQLFDSKFDFKFPNINIGSSFGLPILLQYCEIFSISENLKISCNIRFETERVLFFCIWILNSHCLTSNCVKMRMSAWFNRWSDFKNPFGSCQTLSVDQCSHQFWLLEWFFPRSLKCCLGYINHNILFLYSKHSW